MLAAWTTTTVTVQRRTAASRNALGEPDYGAEADYPTVYSGLQVRIEFVDEAMEWTEAGERVVPKELDMYVEPTITMQPEDRVTITASDAAPIVGQLYLATAVYPEWNSVNQVHHFLVELSVH
jgi:hypothetical protein